MNARQKRSNRFVVPAIKSQGIKTKLVPWILQAIPEYEGRWIEPFMGTGVVALNVKPAIAILNDINPHIIRFYRDIQNGIITPATVRTYLEREGEILRDAGDNGYDHYRAVRARFNTNPNSLDFIFLSRAGFNGMMRFSKKGNWNIPFCKKPNRFAPSYITKIVNQLFLSQQTIRSSWRFSNADFREVIAEAGAGDLIYCDPPYFGRYTDYFNTWSREDEQALHDLLRATKASFILSTWHHNDFRENAMIHTLWSDFNILTKDHFYHSGGRIENRNRVVEALVCNFEVAESLKPEVEGIAVES